MKKAIIRIITIIIVIFIGYELFISVSNMNKPNKESDINGKDISKEEYLYKDDLLEIGYSVDEISEIQNKLTLSDVKNNLLNNKKYDNIIPLINNPYFNITNISRYTKYYKKNPNYSFDQIVLYVEIGLDNEFYTNINIISNYNEVNALVNKYNKLPNGIKFNDLVTLSKKYSDDGKEQVRNVVYDDLIKMIDDAHKENINLFVVSGYRTSKKQESLFNNSKKKNGLKHALLYSAKEGHSEHQLGLAVDLNSVNVNFENTKEYKWLKQNSYKYGFIERYPKGKENITGFAYEPWHYRYLGIDTASKIFEQNITYEEYLVKYKK